MSLIAVKVGFIILLIILFSFFSLNAFAISLKEALKTAYKNNPEINAERENLKVSEEDLKISKQLSDFLKKTKTLIL